MKIQNKNVKRPHGGLKINNSYQGETLEEKINKLMNNNEPIGDTAPIIYTDRKLGVQAGYNIRTDRFDIAMEAMDKVAGAKQTQRLEYLKKRDKPETGSQGGDGNTAA